MRGAINIWIVVLLISAPVLVILTSVDEPIPYGVAVQVPFSIQQVDPTTSNFTIESNDDLDKMVQDRGWTGSGTPLDPYVISGYTLHYFTEGHPFILLSNITKYLVLKNLSFRDDYQVRAGTGIKLQDCSNIRIESCNLSKMWTGIEVISSENVDIMDTWISGYGENIPTTQKKGVVIRECRDVTIEKCCLSIMNKGIQVSDSLSVRIISTWITPYKEKVNGKNRIGIEVKDCPEMLLENSTIKDFDICMDIENCEGAVIKSVNLTSPNSGLWARLSPRMYIYNTTFDVSHLTIFSGVDISNCSDSQLIDCHGHSRWTSMLFKNSDDLIIHNYDASNSFPWVSLENVTNSSFLNNKRMFFILTSSHFNILENIDCSRIYLVRSDNNRILNNGWDGGTSILIDSSDNNLIKGNNISGSSHTGLDFIYNSQFNYAEPQMSVGNVISDNKFMNNARAGIRLYQQYPRDTHIYNNTMFGSGVQIWDYGSVFDWDGVEIPRNNTLDGKPILYDRGVEYDGLGPSDSWGQIFLHNCSNIDLDDHNWSGRFSGPIMNSCSNISISNYQCSGATYKGLWIQGSMNITISGTEMINMSGAGVEILDCSGLSIENSQLDLTGTRLSFVFGEDHRIVNCTFHCYDDSYHRIYFQDIRNSTFKDNDFRMRDSSSIELFNCENMKFFNNSFTGYGLQLGGDGELWSSFSIPSNNTLDGEPIVFFSNMDLSGTNLETGDVGQIILANVSNGVFSGYDLSGMDMNLQIGGCSDLNITGNNFSNSQLSLKFYSCHNCIIENNTFYNITSGIEVKASNSNLIRENDLSYCSRGISLERSSWNNISFNTFINNSCSIYLSKSSGDNSIISNEISRNDPYSSSGVPYPDGVAISITLSPVTKIEQNNISFQRNGIVVSSSSGTTVCNNRIDLTRSCIEIQGYHPITVRSNEIFNSTYGIDLHSYNSRVIDNYLYNCGFAIIFSSESAWNLVEANIVEKCVYGVSLNGYAGVENVIRSNILMDCPVGLVLESDLSRFYENELIDSKVEFHWTWGYKHKYTNSFTFPSNNTLNGKPILYHQDEADITITGGEAGYLVLYNVTGARINDLEITGPFDGVYIESSSNIVFESCSFHDLENGIHSTSEGITILNCSFQNIMDSGVKSSGVGMVKVHSSDFSNIDNYGLSIIGAPDLDLRDSNFTNCKGGMTSSVSSMNMINCQFNDCLTGATLSTHHGGDRGNEIQGNLFHNNSLGLYIYGHRSLVNLTQNVFSENLWGLNMTLEEGSIVTDNDFIANFGPAIVSSSGSEGMVWGNRFIFNNGTGTTLNTSQLQVLDLGYRSYSRTLWYEPVFHVGNYWSDHTEPDEDGDGIVDIPYPVKEHSDPEVRSFDLYPVTIQDFLLPPRDFRGSAKDEGILLEWEEPYAPDMEIVDGYYLFKGQSVDTLSIHSTISVGNNTFFDPEIIPGNDYFYSLTTFKDSMIGLTTLVIKVTADFTAPSVTIIHPANGTWLNNRTIEVIFDAIDEPAGISSIFYNHRYQWVPEPNEYWHPVKDGERIILRNLSDNEYTLFIKVIDLSGNEEIAYSYFSIDTMAPMVTISPLEENGTYKPDQVRIDLHAQETGSGIERYEVYLDKILHNVSYTAGKTRMGSVRFPTITEGIHDINMICYDHAGNAGRSDVRIRVDASAPRLRIISPGDGDIFRTTLIGLEWEFIDNTTDLELTYFRVNGAEWGSVRNNVTIYELNLRRSGTYRIDIVSRDLVGNEFMETVNITVDTIHPEYRIISPEIWGAELDAPILIRFTEKMNLFSIHLFVDGMEGEVTLEGENLTFMPHERWLPDTEYNVSVVGQDIAGNDIKDGIFSFKTMWWGWVKGTVWTSTSGIASMGLIFVNGAEWGRTDQSGNFTIELNGGEHDLSFVVSSHEPYKITINITPGETLDMGNITLIHIPVEGDDDDDVGISRGLRNLLVIIGVVALFIVFVLIVRKLRGEDVQMTEE